MKIKQLDRRNVASPASRMPRHVA